ncbi:MAG: peroxiredoxin [Fimbriimonadales bacterium]
MLKIGDKFPAFELVDQAGAIHSLKSLKGTPFVIFCYPKDATSGCTVEVCEFRDTKALHKLVKLFGISPDTENSHKKFADAQELPYPLLSDPEKQLLDPIGVWGEKSMYGKKYFGVLRTTFFVDSTGKVAHVWEKVKPEGHAAEVLKVVKAILIKK